MIPIDTTTLGYQLLALVAVSGEFPADNLLRLGIGDSYKEKLITLLKDKRLLKVHYKDKLRGYRLTSGGKKLLLTNNPERFSFYLTGNCDTNQPRSDYARRLRLQQSSRVYMLMRNAKITLFRDLKPPVFSQAPLDPVCDMPFPVFYHSREIKELGLETTKINNSRTNGVLLTPHRIYTVFYTGSSALKWEYRTEIRLKALISHHTRQGILAAWYRHDTPIHALFIGSDMETAVKLMTGNGGYKKCYFTLDTSFDYFHFIPDNHAGESLLKILCNPDLGKQLNALLLSDLKPPDKAFPLEHDALKNGQAVLLAYDFDMLRISRFVTSLHLHSLSGDIICFDFQKDALLLYCGDIVTITTIDLIKFERRFLT